MTTQRHTRRGLALLIGTIALGLITACGSGTPGQPAGQTAPDGEGVAGTEAAAEGAVVVDFWQTKFSDPEDAWYKAAVERFNAAQSEVTVRYQVVPSDAWDQKMKAAQAAGSAPDIYTINYAAVPVRARLGELAAITDYVAPEGWDDLDERFLEAVSVGDQHYAYPLLFEPSTVLYYRTDLVEKAGFDPTKPPTTWEELFDWARGIKETSPDVIPMQTAQSAVELGWTTWGLQVGAGGHMPITDDLTTSLITEPGYRRLFEVYQTMAQEGLIAKQALSGYTDGAPLGQGKLGIQISGSWMISQLMNEYPDMVSNIEVAPVPALDGDMTKPTGSMGGWTMVVDAKSDNPAEAGQAISWLLAEDPERVLDYFETTAYSKLSPRQSVTELMSTRDTSANPWLGMLNEKVAPYQVLEPTYDFAVSGAVGEALERVMQGAPIDKAIEDADAVITKAIKDLDLPGRLAS
jgi:multiple sugar transport system substrate-binding protein